METHVFSGYLEDYDPVISIEAILRILEKKNDFIFIYFRIAKVDFCYAPLSETKKWPLPYIFV